MKKKYIIIAVLAIIAVLGVIALVLVNRPVVNKMVPLIREDGSEESVSLRFYKEQPHVPYIGMRAYCDLVGVNPLNLSITADGKYVFTNNQGAEAVADPETMVITVEDWAAFLNPSLPYEGSAKGFKDSDSDFIRITDVSYEGESTPVTFDLKEYGLKMYADDQDVYMSLSLLSSMMSDIATWHTLWNGNEAYLCKFMLEGEAGEDFSNTFSIWKKTRLGRRPQDIAEETYQELCFVLDHFFADTGRAPLTAAVAEKGLDRAITDLGEEGTVLKDKLRSVKTRDYALGMHELFLKYIFDGHTMDYSETELIDYEASIFSGDDVNAIVELFTDMFTYKDQLKAVQIQETRNELWGEDFYRECGNTAIIRVLDFMADEDGWGKYYNGEGDIPEDCVGNVVTGLKKASQNPEIENILFDLSTNDGGQSDALAFICAIATGSDKLYGLDENTGRRFTVTYEADTNLDGVFDEKDAETVYDRFNYGVLTSVSAFSCGNLFPFIMQENGAVLLGEPTGGGGNCVQMGVAPDGGYYTMSSGQWKILTEDGETVEGGCKTDLPIEHQEIVNEETGETEYDYSSYFDDEKLVEMLNEWFEEEGGEEELSPAA